MDVLAKGYRTIYSHDAVVFHSHSEWALVKLQRSFDEFKALKALGAYARMRHPCYMLVSIAYFTLLDLYYLWHPRRNLSLGARLRWTPFAVTRNVARKVGEYLGSRHERIPVGVQRWLSFQERLGSG
jgi:rhamnosyltransferase